MTSQSCRSLEFLVAWHFKGTLATTAAWLSEFERMKEGASMSNYEIAMLVIAIIALVIDLLTFLKK